MSNVIHENGANGNTHLRARDVRYTHKADASKPRFFCLVLVKGKSTCSATCNQSVHPTQKHEHGVGESIYTRHTDRQTDRQEELIRIYTKPALTENTQSNVGDRRHATTIRDFHDNTFDMYSSEEQNRKPRTKPSPNTTGSE